MHYTFDIFGWYTGETEDAAPRSTTVAPPTASTATTPDEPRANFVGIPGQEWEVRPYTHAEPPELPASPPVPAQVTARQAVQALIYAGLIDAVQAAIDAIPDPVARALAQAEWSRSQVFERDRPLLIQLAGAMGLSSEDLDQLFINAAALP